MLIRTSLAVRQPSSATQAFVSIFFRPRTPLTTLPTAGEGPVVPITAYLLMRLERKRLSATIGWGKFCGSANKSGALGPPIPSGRELDQALPPHGVPLD